MPRKTLEELMRCYPNAPWDWLTVSSRVSWKFFERNKEWRWNYGGLSMNKELNWDYVHHNLDKKWSWYNLSGNPKTTWEIVSSYPDYPWDLVAVGANENIPIEVLPPKYWVGLSSRKDLTWEFVISHPKVKWSWWQLSLNPIITWDRVSSHPGNWSYSSLVQNPSISIETMLENPQVNWQWRLYPYRANFSWADVEKYPDIPWNWPDLSYIANDEIMEKYPHAPWNWIDVSGSDITWKYISRNLDKDWAWEILARNETITFEIADSLPFDSHIWKGFSSNPNNSWEIVIRNIRNPWDWEEISYGHFKDKDHWVWNGGRGWIWFLEEEQKEILLAIWACKEWGLDIEIIHMILEELVKSYWYRNN